MKNWLLACIAALCILVATVVPARAQVGAQPGGGPATQCLSNELKETIRKKKESARRTVDGEQDDPLDPDYFLGVWKMESVAPDSPLGNAGEVTGTLTVTHVEGCYYQGDLEARGPDGAYRSRIQLIYDLERRYLVWLESDSRGMTMIRVGPIGGDLGGYYTHFWEQLVITVAGTSVRLRGTTFVQSPAVFLMRRQISTDTNPYVNFGTVTFSKESPPSSGK